MGLMLSGNGTSSYIGDLLFVRCYDTSPYSCPMVLHLTQTEAYSAFLDMTLYAHSAHHCTPCFLLSLQQRAPSSLRALHLLLSLLSSPVHTWFRLLPPSGHSCMSAHQWCPLDHPQHSPCPFPAIFFSTALITFGHVISSIVFTCLLFVLPMSSKQPEVRDFCFLF